MDVEVLATEDLVKSYAGRRVVDEVDLSVTSGSLFGLLGPNGAGKTTTLRMIAGLSRQDSGEVRLLGKSVPRDLPHLCHRIGFVLEASGFYPSMSAHENLRVLASMRGVRWSRSDSMMLLDRMGLRRRIGDRVGTFSHGMRQRLLLGAAIMHDPELLILDEPLTGLDPAGIRDLRELLRELKREGRTVVFSSHVLSEIEAVCDEIAVMHDGRIVAQGGLDELRPVHLRLHGRQSKELGEVLARLGGRTVSADGGILVHGITRERALRAKVEARFEHVEVTEERRSLEDVFFGAIAERE